MPFIAKPTLCSEDATPPRDSIGGHPFLPEGTDWPLCPSSGKRMVFFFQFDTRAEFGLTLAAGSHLAVFMSPEVNEIATFNFVGVNSTDGSPYLGYVWFSADAPVGAAWYTEACARWSGSQYYGDTPANRVRP